MWKATYYRYVHKMTTVAEHKITTPAYCVGDPLCLCIGILPYPRGPTPIEYAYEIYKSHDLKVDL